MKFTIAVLFVAIFALSEAINLKYKRQADNYGGYEGYQQPMQYQQGGQGGFVPRGYRAGPAQFTVDRWDTNAYNRDWGKKNRFVGVLIPVNQQQQQQQQQQDQYY